jgi:hypothetical protein
MVDFPLLVFVVSFAMLVIAAWIGDFARKRFKASEEANLGVVLAGTLTLLGLIIGFSFSMATSRYDLRKNSEQAEANAIAVVYMRADLLLETPTAMRSSRWPLEIGGIRRGLLSLPTSP